MRQPRIALIVANPVSGDSRVIKTAVSARRMGADVVVVGTTTNADRTDTMLGDIRVVRVVAAPSGGSGRRIVERFQGGWRIRPLAPIAFGSTRAYSASSDLRTRRRAATRVAIEKIKSDLRTDIGPLRRVVLSVRLNGHRGRSLFLDAWFVLRRRAYVRPPIEVGRVDERSELDRLLMESLPFVAGYVAEMTPILEEFEPDLIHAHDVFMAGVAASYAARSHKLGHRVPWIYDAHEWVAGLRSDRAIAKTIAADDLERLVAPTADAVCTVGDALAVKLTEALALRSEPTVILNAPPARTNRESRCGSVRSEFGLDADVPVLVYPGVVKPKRGLDTVVDALAELENVHLAILADIESPMVSDLRERALDRGVSERVHIRPYVPADQIVPFISDASIGIYPLLRYPNADVAIPTKLLEYTQAALPVVVSDATEMASFVRRHGIGEVFSAGDAEGFARSVRTVLAERSTYVGQYSAALMDSFTWERQEPELKRLYESVLGRTLSLDSAPFATPTERGGGQ